MKNSSNVKIKIKIYFSVFNQLNYSGKVLYKNNRLSSKIIGCSIKGFMYQSFKILFNQSNLCYAIEECV